MNPIINPIINALAQQLSEEIPQLSANDAFCPRDARGPNWTRQRTTNNITYTNTTGTEISISLNDTKISIFCITLTPSGNHTPYAHTTIDLNNPNSIETIIQTIKIIIDTLQ